MKLRNHPLLFVLFLTLLLIFSSQSYAQTNYSNNISSLSNKQYQYILDHTWSIDRISPGSDFISYQKISYSIEFQNIEDNNQAVTFDIVINAEYLENSSSLYLSDGTVLTPSTSVFQKLGDPLGNDAEEEVNYPSFSWRETIFNTNFTRANQISDTHFGPAYKFEHGDYHYGTYIHDIGFSRFNTNNFALIPLDADLQLGETLNFDDPLVIKSNTSIDYTITREEIIAESDYWVIEFDQVVVGYTDSYHLIGIMKVDKITGLIIELDLTSDLQYTGFDFSSEYHYYIPNPSESSIDEDEARILPFPTIEYLLILILSAVKYNRKMKQNKLFEKIEFY